MPGVGQPGGGGSATNPDGTPRVEPHPDDPIQYVDWLPSFEHKNINVFKCSPRQGQQNLVNAINELYKNIEYILNYNSQFRLRVSNNDGSVAVYPTLDLIANCMNVEDLGDNTARITPKTSQIFQAPAGGIAASTTSTLASATCTKLEIQSGVLNSTGQTATVYNLNDSAISGNAIFIGHSVYGCAYVAMACCEQTTLTPGSGGAGGTTDPPDPPDGGGSGDPDFPRGNCAFVDPTKVYYQYDISVYGYFDSGMLANPRQTCVPTCILSESEPLVVRLTFWPDLVPANVMPCSSNACGWYGSVDSDCMNVSIWMTLHRLQSGDVPAKFQKCINAGFFEPEDIIDPSGHYVEVWIGTSGKLGSFIVGGESFFSKKLDSTPGTEADMNLSGFEIDIGKYSYVATQAQLDSGSAPEPCQPKALTPDPTKQGRTYVSITKVESGGTVDL